MASGPFLLPFHTDPIPSFWSEWWAGALGLAAVVTGLIVIRGRSVVLPRVLLVPGVLLLTLLVQFGLGRLAFPQIGLLYAAYLLWAGILMILGRHLFETAGMFRLADVIAWALVLGALVGAGIALAQWLSVNIGMGWMLFSKPGGAIYGNLGQANHHAHYSWLGIASVFYLCGRGMLSRSLLWALILLIGFASALSGSRSVFLYPLVIISAIGWSRIRQPRGPAAFLLPYAALLLPVMVGLSLLGTWATPYLSELTSRELAAGMAGTRLYDSLSGSSTRLEMARSAWSAFLEMPWLGQGVGNFRWTSFVAASSQVGNEPFAVSEHAHNIVLHLLAEFGAVPTGMVVLVLGIWAKDFLGRSWGLEQFWFATILGIGAVHSLLEYPLWHAYFLGPAALLLGAADSRQIMVLPARRAAIYLVFVSLVGVSILTSLRKDYGVIESVSYYPLTAHPDREQAWSISMDRLLKLQRESLLSPWALLAFTILAEPKRQPANDRAALCVRGIRLFPARWLVTRCAIQLAIAGRDQDARQLAGAVLRAFPAQRDATLAELAGGAEQFPEVRRLLAAVRGGEGSSRGASPATEVFAR